MEKVSSKLKLVKILEILREETDEFNKLSTKELLDRLKDYGIDCDRKTLYKDIELLNKCGYEIMQEREKSNRYFIVEQSFDIPEYRILIDAVQAANFITEKKSKELIEEIYKIAGKCRAEILKNSIAPFNITKHKNESIYLNIANVEDGIAEKKKIRFKYFNYDMQKKRKYRNGDNYYVVSPLATALTNDNYYLVCYDDRHDGISHYRIDRMENVELCSEDIESAAETKVSDIQKDRRQTFGMYVGKVQNVQFEISESLIDVVMDKFGEEVKFSGMFDGKVKFSEDVQISPVFYAWCCTFGSDLKVIAPKNVVEGIRDTILELSKIYKD